MNRPGALALSLVCAASMLIRGRAEAAADEESLARIQAMSRVDRLRMSKALEAFDGLDRSDRDAVRELDNRLAELDPESRARYLAVLRRYHVFYQALPKDKRDALDRETDSAKKLNLIATYRAEQKGQPIPAKALADGIQVSTLSPLRLRWVARHLIVYFSLDPVKDAKERTEFARSKTAQERESLIAKLLPAKARGERQELREKLREEKEEFDAAEEAVRKNPALAKRLLQGQDEAVRKNPAIARRPAQGKDEAGKAANSTKPGPDAKADDPFAKLRADLVQKLDEQQVIRELDAETVHQANLDRFDAALPPWARESLDMLPPDAARRRLKALYRLVFPTPEEIPIPKNTAPSKAKRPAASGPGEVSPF